MTPVSSSPTTPSRKPSRQTAASVAAWVAGQARLFQDEASPFRAEVAEGAPGIVIVTGENASGKSLFVRIAAARAQRPHGILPVSVSIRERSGGGTHEMSRMRQAMMFGEEGEQSTGATSVGVVEQAFGNLDHDGGSFLILDEPEIGLAEAYTRALGEFIGRQADSTPTTCRGVIVVTHSRPLVQGILDGSAATPTHVAVAADTAPQAGIERWLATPEHHTVEELLALNGIGFDRWRRVTRLLDDK